jgi:hypothetical protein
MGRTAASGSPGDPRIGEAFLASPGIPALRVDDIDSLAETLAAAGCDVSWDSAGRGCGGLHRDPFGNRVGTVRRDLEGRPSVGRLPHPAGMSWMPRTPGLHAFGADHPSGMQTTSFSHRWLS